jgi:hypothetical protein
VLGLERFTNLISLSESTWSPFVIILKPLEGDKFLALGVLLTGKLVSGMFGSGVCWSGLGRLGIGLG